MKKIKQLINCSPVVKMPSEVSRRKNMILTIEIISTGILDLLSFSIKGAQFAISMKLNFIAFVCILMYFLRDVLAAAVQAFTDAQKNRFNEQQDSFIIENVSIISNIVRGKVLSHDNGFSKIMTNSEVILVMKEFIGYIWQFIICLPTAVASIFTAVVLSIGILVTEFLQTQNLGLTLCLCGILVLCVCIFAFLYTLRLNIRKKYRQKHRILRKENEVLFNDIKNIEPLINDEFAYRISLLIDNIKTKRITEKVEDLKLNVVQIFRTIVLAIFMVSIIVIKLHYAGGINNLTLEIMTDIFSISTVYSAILNKVATILRKVEEMSNITKDAESVKPDFDNIMQVYETEMLQVAKTQQVENIQVNPFSFTYPSAQSVYKLQNPTQFSIKKGSSYLVSGHTGCGKSTFMHIITGKIKLDESPISYGDTCQKAYLASIMHETNGKLGSNPILEELIFSKDYSTLNHQKMIEILKGTHIYNDIMRNLGLSVPDDEEVLEYLKTSTIEQYSSGQKQRLAIVKVLYNLTSDHQIVVFDEATNALDNETAKTVLKFMANYCQKEQPRIVFFVTHQVDITKEITQGSITFNMNQFPVFEIVSK